MSGKERVDVLLVQRGLAPSRSAAQRLVMAGQVRLAGTVVAKPSERVLGDAELTVVGGPRYVSRGGEKLEAALAAFPVRVADRVCADVGASTGGFSDCLLQHGARRVYAIDVGEGILHWKLRREPRLVSLEGQNARRLERLAEPIGLATIDASFISLRTLLPVVAGWLEPGGEIVALIKPQFEAGRGAVGHGGVVRKAATHRRVLAEVLGAAAACGLPPAGLIRSPLIGPKGNVEFLLWSRAGALAADPAALVDSVVPPDAEA